MCAVANRLLLMPTWLGFRFVGTSSRTSSNDLMCSCRGLNAEHLLWLFNDLPRVHLSHVIRGCRGRWLVGRTNTIAVAESSSGMYYTALEKAAQCCSMTYCLKTNITANRATRSSVLSRLRDCTDPVWLRNSNGFAVRE